MAKTITNCLYNKIKLLHELSSMLWFIEQHAAKDAEQEKAAQCHLLLDRLEKDLEKYVHEFKEMVCKCK